jgi:hypothetical protein
LNGRDADPSEAIDDDGVSGAYTRCIDARAISGGDTTADEGSGIQWDLGWDGDAGRLRHDGML